MVSAIAPNAKILLVEASSSSMANLGKAVNEAVTLGAKFVSNSYGGSESSSDTSYDSSYFNHPGVAITVSAGDEDYGAEYPAASKYVTSVGGTALSTSSNSRGWTETVWKTSSTEVVAKTAPREMMIVGHRIPRAEKAVASGSAVSSCRQGSMPVSTSATRM